MTTTLDGLYMTNTEVHKWHFDKNDEMVIIKNFSGLVMTFSEPIAKYCLFKNCISSSLCFNYRNYERSNIVFAECREINYINLNTNDTSIIMNCNSSMFECINMGGVNNIIGTTVIVNKQYDKLTEVLLNNISSDSRITILGGSFSIGLGALLKYKEQIHIE